MNLVATEAIASAEALDLTKDTPLLLFKTRELGVALRQATQVVADERADGCPALRRMDAGVAVDLVRDRDCDVLGHEI